MGLLLLTPKEKINMIRPQIHAFTDCPLKRNNQLQIQGLKINFHQGLKLAFLYCRSTPNVKESEAIAKAFDESHFILGDMNLSLKKVNEKQKLDIICGE